MPAAGTLAKLGVLVPVKAGHSHMLQPPLPSIGVSAISGRARGASKIVGLSWDSVMQIMMITLLLSGKLELSSHLLSC